ncbi:MAG: 4-vinyl reductase [Candidatus Diapherotrites archaeon]
MLNTFFDRFIFANALTYKHNNFYLVNTPFVISPTDILVSLVAQNDSELNTKIYYAIKESTKNNLLKQLGLDFRVENEKAVSIFTNFFTASGWGKIEKINFDVKEKRAIVSLENSPFASALRWKTNKPVDHFMRGLLAGFFSKLFNLEVDCVETKCAAMNHNSCEFIIKSRSDFDFSLEEVKDQLGSRL